MYYQHIGPVGIKSFDVWIWQDGKNVERFLNVRAYDNHAAIAQAQLQMEAPRAPTHTTIFEVRPNTAGGEFARLTNYEEGLKRG